MQSGQNTSANLRLLFQNMVLLSAFQTLIFTKYYYVDKIEEDGNMTL
jgi:hypothetical protein